MSLRQLIFSAAQESLKPEYLTKSELHETTEYILNNSVLELTAERVCLTEGNYIGIGENNKDRVITLPRFLTFEFSKRSAFDFFNSNKGRTWKLRSHNTFEELESYLQCKLNSEPVVFIDGELIEYRLTYAVGWGYEVEWISCDAVYIVTYLSDDTEEKEIFKSKYKLQKKLIELVNQNAQQVQAYNVIAGISTPFEVQGVLYDSNTPDNKRNWLIWGTDSVEDDEVEEPF